VLLLIINAERVSEKLHEECSKGRYTGVTIKFRKSGTTNKFFDYTEPLDVVSLSSDEWHEVIDRGEKHCAREHKTDIDRVEAIVLTPAQGIPINIII